MKRTAVVIAVLMLITLAGCRAGPTNKPPDISDWLEGGLMSAPTSEGQRADGDSDTSSGQNAGALPSTGRVVVITNRIDEDPYTYGEEYTGAEELAARYGEEQVAHMTWPHWDASADKVAEVLQGVSEDPEVRAVVLTESSTGYTHAIDALQYLRDDIFVVYIAARWLDRAYAATVGADLIIQTDMQRFGELYVAQAISMGAETIAHYSTPRLDVVPGFAMRRDAMKATTEREGVGFVELVAPDYQEGVEMGDMEMFMVQDMPRQVERLGANTAFFSEVCYSRVMQIPMVSQTVATGAVFPSICCLSPYHGYPEAFEVEFQIPTGETDEYGGPITAWLELPELLRAIDTAADASGAAGRISSWAVPDGMMWVTIGGMYALEWIGGSVPHERGAIDIEALRRLASEYAEQIGVDAGATLEPIDLDGETIEHYILGTVGFHVFGNRR